MKSLSRFLLFLFMVLVVLAGFVFTLKNNHLVEFWLIRDFAPRPLSLWVLAAFVAGGFSGLLLGIGLWRNFRNRLRLHQLESRLQKNQQTISQLQQELQLTREKSQSD